MFNPPSGTFNPHRDQWSSVFNYIKGMKMKSLQIGFTAKKHNPHMFLIIHNVHVHNTSKSVYQYTKSFNSTALKESKMAAS